MARWDSNTGDTQIGLILRSSLNSGAWNVGSVLASTAAGAQYSIRQLAASHSGEWRLEIERPVYIAAMADHRDGDEAARSSMR